MNKMDKPISTAHDGYFLDILYSSNNLLVGRVDISYMYTVMMQRILILTTFTKLLLPLLSTHFVLNSMDWLIV